MELLNSSLFKLFVGVLLAIALRIYMKNNGKPTCDDMLEEIRILLPPAVLVGVGFLASAGSWLEAVEGFLTAIAVPLGINSKKE